ncbi:MAG: hypothetical protein PHC31_01025 [Clostridia bacterium]|nr:hypothetical protein [Clostridia bacterium]MDD3970476.1 hypothetical protein [Clostridia bacterium]
MKQNNKIDLFLDSGAFSALTQKTTINIDEYIAFIKKHEKDLTIYANLDYINPKDKGESAKKTWQNQQAMEKAGLSPLPVFHYGEDEKWLKRYIASGYTYIALGGMVKTPNLVAWLDRIWSTYLVDDNGMPKIKVHGFGLTSLSLMSRYPWYSVDSTSWVVTGRLGSIYIPRRSNGKWVYDDNSWKIAVSNKSPSMKDKDAHITTLPEEKRQLCLQYIEEKGYKLGKSRFRMVRQDRSLKDNERWAEKKPKDKDARRKLEVIQEAGVSNTYQLRDEMNILYFLDLEKSMPKWPCKFTAYKQSGLRQLKF